jgi:hypothetical protein
MLGIPVTQIFQIATAPFLPGAAATGLGLPVVNTITVTQINTNIVTVVTQNQNVNVFTSVNSGTTNVFGPMSGQQQPSSWLKILDTLMKIICGIAIAILVVNIVIKFFKLGKNHLGIQIIGSGKETTKLSWWRLAIRKLDVLAFIERTGAAITNKRKADILSSAVLKGWIEKDPNAQVGAVPSYSTNGYQLKGAFLRANNRPDLIDGTIDIDQACALEGVPVPKITFGGQGEGDYDPTEPKAKGDLQTVLGSLEDGDWEKISASSQKVAEYFAHSEDGNCEGCDSTPCGNVYVRACHPLDVCIAEEGAGSSTCDEYLCNDYTYYVQLIMTHYPPWFRYMSPRSRANFHKAYVNDGSVITIPRAPANSISNPILGGAAFDFKYIDIGTDIRWSEHEYLEDTLIQGDYTHTGGELMSSLAWPRKFDGRPQSAMGICCDPYADNNSFGDYADDDKETHGQTELSYQIIPQDGGHGGVTTADGGDVPNQLQMSMALVSPRYRNVKWADFHTSHFGAKSHIDKLCDENNKARAINASAPNVHTTIAFTKLTVGNAYPVESFTYRGFKVYDNSNTKIPFFVAYAVAWETIEKDCSCATEGLFGAGTPTNAMHELVVGAEYEIALKRVTKPLCDKSKGSPASFAFPGSNLVENKANFMVSCGKEDAPPGNMFINITQGYSYLGGNPNPRDK